MKKNYVDILYPEFNTFVKVEEWSCSQALVMPHFSDISIELRKKFLISIHKLLIENFLKKNLVHNDVKLRNIGC